MTAATTSPAPTDGTHERLRALLEYAPMAVAFVRRQRFEAVSDHMNHLFGQDDGAGLAGHDVGATLVSEGAHKGLAERMDEAFAAGRSLDEDIEYVRRDGSRFWGRLHARPVQWSAKDGDVLWIVEDVTAAREQRLHPHWNNRHDPVTELSNKREFERRMSEYVGSQRHIPVSMLWVDIDRFHGVSQRVGEESANRFLYLLGRLMVATVRASDIVARIETDKFAVLLPECDQHYAQLVGEKLRAAIAGYRLRYGLQSLKVKACVGVVQLHRSMNTVESVLDAASGACAAAKKAGGDSVRVFVPAAGNEAPPASNG